ncbi:hypothetical protein HZB60_10405 [candidate division KSB1 bacterium]|nr:hypothetical protein [candidate division KSB1 bacterium]
MPKFPHSRLIARLCLAALVSLLASGCIVAEKKEYRFKVSADGSGTGSIRFINLLSSDDDDKDVSFKDFAELVTDYVEGTKWEDENAAFRVTEKKLYEEGGVLVGEIKFTFSSWDSAGFMRAANCDCCPVLYYLDTGSETFESSNGNYLGESGKLPLISFDGKATEFSVATVMSNSIDDTHPLLPHYHSWKK